MQFRQPSSTIQGKTKLLAVVSNFAEAFLRNHFGFIWVGVSNANPLI